MPTTLDQLYHTRYPLPITFFTNRKWGKRNERGCWLHQRLCCFLSCTTPGILSSLFVFRRKREQDSDCNPERSLMFRPALHATVTDHTQSSHSNTLLSSYRYLTSSHLLSENHMINSTLHSWHSWYS